ncbi:aminoacyl--tRNA ligase-related protein, partial [Microbacterium sp. NPDC096154]|uniref:aminoacyl--tRNA ligase-related protein n=1 Tax=Microbacterium sp. NPDC096154 TaxID=3155549 RepID=UPI00331AC58C
MTAPAHTAPAHTAPAPRTSTIGRAFAAIAFIEAFTWAGLLVGMYHLPLRLAENGTVYRNELSGALHGLTRVRGFTQ